MWFKDAVKTYLGVNCIEVDYETSAILSSESLFSRFIF